MTGEQIEAIRGRAEAALNIVPMYMNSFDLSWQESPCGAELYEDVCPLCEGSGLTHASRYEHKTPSAALIVYGRGDGLRLTDEWCAHGATDTLLLVAEVERLQKLVNS